MILAVQQPHNQTTIQQVKSVKLKTTIKIYYFNMQPQL